MLLETEANSMAGTIRSLLLRAWRERWSDMQWGIHIKEVLPRFVSGDIYQLSDCILQQALMGPLPNTLILSYLQHSLSSQMVSFGGVIESISKYETFGKPHCVNALLCLLHSMLKSVSCRGKPDDCLHLATSLVSGVKWVVQVMSWTVQQLIELRTATEHVSNLTSATSVLTELVNSEFLICMLTVGQKEETGDWSECLKKITELEIVISEIHVTIIENKEAIVDIFVQLRTMNPLHSLCNNHIYDSTSVPLCYALHGLVMMEVTLHATRDKSFFLQEISLLQKLKGLTKQAVNLELLRSCFLGLSQSELQHYDELRWVGFVFIKLPSILLALHNNLKVEGSSSTDPPSEDLLKALKELSSFTSLLDIVDSRLNCNCLEYLLNEIYSKTGLISERDAQTIVASRVQDSNVLGSIEQNESQTASHAATPNLILRAEPTVTNILKTLSNKNQESVLPVINLLVSGKSRDLLLTASAAMGNLHNFAQKFVRYIELNLEPQPGETPAMAASRALMFDISFLLLCHIALVYGIDVVVSERCDTFVECWMRDNMPQRDILKSPASSETSGLPPLQDFIRQINNTDVDTKYSQVHWGQVCQLSSVALHQMVSASQQGLLPDASIKGLLDQMAGHLCSLPICITAWLCSYLQVDGSESTSSLPWELLQYLQTSLLAERDGLFSSLENYKDRSTLMVQIIDNLVQVTKFSLNVTSNPLGTVGTMSAITSSQPLSTILSASWKKLFARGTLSHTSLASFKDLLRLGGAKWFTEELIRTMMQNVFKSELSRSVDIIYGLFHLDLLGCTLSLLLHTLPLYMSGSCTGELSCELRVDALARLCVTMVVTTWVSVCKISVKLEPGAPLPNVSRKRSYASRELEFLEGQLRQRAGEVLSSQELGSLQGEAVTLLAAVNQLFQDFAQICRSASVNPVTQFIHLFLKGLVTCPHTSPLLTLLPSTLLPNLIPSMYPTNTFTYTQLVALSDPLSRPESDLDPWLECHSRSKVWHSTAAKMLCLQRNLALAEMRHAMV